MLPMVYWAPDQGHSVPVNRRADTLIEVVDTVWDDVPSECPAQTLHRVVDQVFLVGTDGYSRHSIKPAAARIRTREHLGLPPLHPIDIQGVTTYADQIHPEPAKTPLAKPEHTLKDIKNIPELLKKL